VAGLVAKDDESVSGLEFGIAGGHACEDDRLAPGKIVTPALSRGSPFWQRFDERFSPFRTIADRLPFAIRENSLGLWAALPQNARPVFHGSRVDIHSHQR